jgi:transcription elongation factor Elf1
MASYTHDCPYCAAKNSTFTVAGEHKHLAKAHAWSVLLICGSCGNGAVAEVSDNGNRTPPLKHPHDLTLRD